MDSPQTATRVLEPMALEVVTDTTGLGRLRADYERLTGLTGTDLPFSYNEWHVAWCSHFLAAGGWVRASSKIYVVYDTAKLCVAIVPMIWTRRRFGPLGVTTLDILGPDPAISEIRAPLVAPGYEAPVAAMVQRQLAIESGWDWVRWTGLNSAFGHELARHAHLQWEEPLFAYVLDLPAQWELLHASLKRNIRESLRHCYNALKRDRLEFSLRVARDPLPVRAALGRFLELHTLRKRQSGSVPHKDYFDGERPRAFLYDVCHRLALRDAVRVYELLVDGKVVAARVGFVVGSGLYLYYSGFDPRWRRYSVMTTTVAEAIKHAIGEGLRTVNFSTGTDVSKTRWGPRKVIYGNAFQVARSPKSRIAHALYRRWRPILDASPIAQVRWNPWRRRWR